MYIIRDRICEKWNNLQNLDFLITIMYKISIVGNVTMKS